MLVLRGALGPTLLVAIWLGAALTIVLHVAWYDAPKWLSAALYVVLGWVGAAAVPQMIRQLGWAPFGLIAGGGVLYSIGAVIYATRRPDPAPAVFGYHEVFHTLVVVAAAMHYVVVATVVMPRA
jgi:hemolysin III